MPDASLAFYRDTLGFEVRNDVGYGGRRWIMVGPPDQPGTSIVLHPPAATHGVTDRTLLIADCVLRSLTLAGLGLLAVTQRLTLPVLIVGLVLGATFRMAGSSSRRLLATSMAGEPGRFAVNGLLGLNATFALYIVGPVLGGLIVASTSAGAAFLFDAGGALWTTGSMVAAPLGLMVGGPLIELAGTTGGLVLSGGLTLLLVPIAALTVVPRSTSRARFVEAQRHRGRRWVVPGGAGHRADPANRRIPLGRAVRGDRP